MGATNQGSTAAGMLAVALVQQGRHTEAIRYADLAAAWGRARRHRLAGSAALGSRTRSRGERRARARRGDRPRSGATLRALRRHLPARRRGRPPRGRAGPRRPRRRRGPRRSETPSTSTNATATWSPPPARRQLWSARDTAQQSRTRSQRREPPDGFPQLASATHWRPQRLLLFACKRASPLRPRSRQLRTSSGSPVSCEADCWFARTPVVRPADPFRCCVSSNSIASAPRSSGSGRLVTSGRRSLTLCTRSSSPAGVRCGAHAGACVRGSATAGAPRRWGRSPARAGDPLFGRSNVLAWDDDDRHG
jgi:hypothetical protein